MKKHWPAALFLIMGLPGCGMLGMTRQVVVPPSTVDDYRSPAWVIHGVPAGARLPTDDADD